MSRLSCIALLLAVPFGAAAQNGPAVDAVAQRFNKLYAAPSNLFSVAPNALLARTVDGLKPGRALDVAMGQGRNSVFLAKQGWEVTGYDVSDAGLEVARNDAKKAGVRINAVRASHQDFDFGREQWDLIVMTYTLADMENAAFLSRVRDSLKPGGIVLVEQMNAGGTGKGPANALFRSFQDLRILQRGCGRHRRVGATENAHRQNRRAERLATRARSKSAHGTRISYAV